ncbi:MAG TPA: M56 family metallopeptidase, partial [Gemmatimonadales bacterium]|nr:M56 family metallopeptidase [Gemmatimonadales bacterium]
MRADLTLLLGSWLLTYLLHSTLLLGGAWLALRVWRLTPAVRDTLWKVGMAGALFTSAVQAGLGLEPLGGLLALRAPAPMVEPARAPLASSDSAWSGILPAAPSPARKAITERAPAAEGPIVSAAAPAPAVPDAPSAAPAPTRSAAERLVPSLVGLWALVAGLLLALYLVRRARAMREIGPRSTVADPALLGMLDALCASGGVSRRIRLTCADGLGSPVALGASEIVLPRAALTELDAEQQRSMLAHELAHLARRDPTWLAFGCMVERVFFLQPLNRVARAGMQEAAELLCDDWAVRRTGSGFSLATCLVKVAEWVDTTPRPVPLAGMAEHRSQLVTRIHRLIEGRTMPSAPRSLWLAAGAVMLLGITAVAAPGVTPVRPVADPGTDAVTGDTIPAADYAEALAAAAADTDTVVASASGGRGAWSRAGAQMRALERRLSTLARSRAYTDQARAELRAARAVAPMAWAGPAPMAPRPPMPALAPVAGVGRLWGRNQERDTTSIAVPALIAALRDSDVEVRRAAAHSLSNLEDPRAVPALIEARKDSDA